MSAEAMATMNRYGDRLYSACVTSDGAVARHPVLFHELTSRSERIVKARLNHTFFRQIANLAGSAHPLNTFFGQRDATRIEEALVPVQEIELGRSHTYSQLQKIT